MSEETISERLRSWSHNVHGRSGVAVAELMRQAADALEGKTIGDEQIHERAYETERAMLPDAEEGEKLVANVRACFEFANILPEKPDPALAREAALQHLSQAFHK